jgi:enolase-phosphatase E1
MQLRARVALFDIEGTIGSIAFVRDVLFPYARARIASFARAHEDDPRVRAIFDEAAREAGADVHDLAAIVAALHAWSDRDVKVTPLKTLQGLIWKGGFESGELVAELYPDAVEAMQRFRASGAQLAIYSSGSVAAQQLLLGHTAFGDLRPWIRAYYDTTTGPKRDAASYAAIAADLRHNPHGIVFFSDHPAELDAARAAGMQTVQLARPSDNVRPAGTHAAAETFAGIELTG